MSYPRPDDPAYCPGSNEPCLDWTPERQWFRCPACQRLLVPRPRAHTFHPHVSDRRRTRVSDRIRESLDAHGLNDHD